MTILPWYRLVQINILYFGLQTLSTTNGFILPLLVQQLVGSQQQGLHFGQLRLWSLMAAILTQSLMGALSDRSTLRWGRRRPFILVGSILTLAMLWIIGVSPLFHGGGSYPNLFISLVFVQISFNIIVAGQNGVIPDLVLEGQRGIASGVKALLETPLALIFVALFIGSLISQGELWPALQIVMMVFLLTGIISLTVKEQPWKPDGTRIEFKALLRLFLMTACFTAIILGLGAFVRFIIRWMATIPGDLMKPVTVGIAGLVCIVITLFVGTWLSVYIGLGKTALKERPAYGWWLVHRLAFMTGIFNMGVFIIYFIQSRMNVTGEQAAGVGTIFMAILAFLISALVLLSGWLADRYGKKPLAILGGLIAGLGTGILLVSTNLFLSLLGGGLIGCGAGFFFPSSWALGTLLIPPAEAGKYLGIQNLAAAGAGAVGAYIGGPIADYFSLSFPHIPGLGYSVLYATFGMLYLLSAVALTRVRSV